MRLTAAVFIVFFALTAAANAADDRPNIVLILIDDMGWSDVRCYGNEFNETPNINRLAKEGVRFTDFYASCPVCSPTRAAIQSGQYQARFGLTDFIAGHWRPFEKLDTPRTTTAMPAEIVTVGEALAAAGYKTGYFGKWHLGTKPEHLPGAQGYAEAIETRGGHFAPGFQTIPKEKLPRGEYLANYLTDKTVEFIERHHDDGPFFVQLSHFAVHIPLGARHAKVEKYRKKPKPDHGVNNPVYAAMVEHVDDSVGRVMKKLEELGIADNTLVVFTSDNGGLYKRYDGGGDACTSNAPLRDEKGSLYEGGIRVPMIIRWPGKAKAGGTCDEPTISIDFYPTFLAAAKADAPEQILDGKDLAPVLADPAASLSREAIYFHYPHYHHSRPGSVIRMGDWKMIEFFDQPAPVLYNLAEDIGETTDLAAAQPDRMKEMKAKLAAWRKEVGAKLPVANPKYDAARAKEWWNFGNKKPLDTKQLDRWAGTQKDPLAE